MVLPFRGITIPVGSVVKQICSRSFRTAREKSQKSIQWLRYFAFPPSIPARSLEISFSIRSSFQKYHELSLEVHDFYFGAVPVNGSLTLPFINLLSDVNFAYPTAKAARTHAQRSSGNTYFYQFVISLFDAKKTFAYGFDLEFANSFASSAIALMSTHS